MQIEEFHHHQASLGTASHIKIDLSLQKQTKLTSLSFPHQAPEHQRRKSKIYSKSYAKPITTVGSIFWSSGFVLWNLFSIPIMLLEESTSLPIFPPSSKQLGKLKSLKFVALLMVM